MTIGFGVADVIVHPCTQVGIVFLFKLFRETSIPAKRQARPPFPEKLTGHVTLAATFRNDAEPIGDGSQFLGSQAANDFPFEVQKLLCHTSGWLFLQNGVVSPDLPCNRKQAGFRYRREQGP
jgi:hypothetical protein